MLWDHVFGWSLVRFRRSAVATANPNTDPHHTLFLTWFFLILWSVCFCGFLFIFFKKNRWNLLKHTLSHPPKKRSIFQTAKRFLFVTWSPFPTPILSWNWTFFHKLWARYHKRPGQPRPCGSYQWDLGPVILKLPKKRFSKKSQHELFSFHLFRLMTLSSKPPTFYFTRWAAGRPRWWPPGHPGPVAHSEAGCAALCGGVSPTRQPGGPSPQSFSGVPPLANHRLRICDWID